MLFWFEAAGGAGQPARLLNVVYCALPEAPRAPSKV